MVHGGVQCMWLSLSTTYSRYLFQSCLSLSNNPSSPRPLSAQPHLQATRSSCCCWWPLWQRWLWYPEGPSSDVGAGRAALRSWTWSTVVGSSSSSCCRKVNEWVRRKGLSGLQWDWFTWLEATYMNARTSRLSLSSSDQCPGRVGVWVVSSAGFLVSCARRGRTRHKSDACTATTNPVTIRLPSGNDPETGLCSYMSHLPFIDWNPTMVEYGIRYCFGSSANTTWDILW